MIDIVGCHTASNWYIYHVNFVEILKWLHEQIVQIVTIAKQWVTENEAELRNGAHASVQALRHLLVHVQRLKKLWRLPKAKRLMVGDEELSAALIRDYFTLDALFTIEIVLHRAENLHPVC